MVAHLPAKTTPAVKQPTQAILRELRQFEDKAAIRANKRWRMHVQRRAWLARVARRMLTPALALADTRQRALAFARTWERACKAKQRHAPHADALFQKQKRLAKDDEKRRLIHEAKQKERAFRRARRLAHARRHPHVPQGVSSFLASKGLVAATPRLGHKPQEDVRLLLKARRRGKPATRTPARAARVVGKYFPTPGVNKGFTTFISPWNPETRARHPLTYAVKHVRVRRVFAGQTRERILPDWEAALQRARQQAQREQQKKQRLERERQKRQALEKQRQARAYHARVQAEKRQALEKQRRDREAKRLHAPHKDAKFRADQRQAEEKQRLAREAK